jgi:hypothetical protein
VESAINSRYIELDPEVNATKFLKSLPEQNKLLARRLTSHDVPSEIQAAIDKASAIEQDSGWPRNLRERACAVESPSFTYDVVFLMLSQLVHSDIASLAGQVKIAGNDQLRVTIGRGPEWVGTSLATAFIFLHQIAQVAYKAFGYRNDSLTSLEQKFKTANVALQDFAEREAQL